MWVPRVILKRITVDFKPIRVFALGGPCGTALTISVGTSKRQWAEPKSSSIYDNGA